MQNLLEEELSSKGGPLYTLETGSIRSEEPRYKRGDGWSTLSFARHVQKNGGKFTSIDLNTLVAHNVLSREGLREYVDLRRGNSLDVLPLVVEEIRSRGSFLDVVLLDSDNDADLIRQEFRLVSRAMTSGSVLLVDDVMLDSDIVLKGHKIFPDLLQQGYRPQILTREGDGFTRGVMRVVL